MLLYLAGSSREADRVRDMADRIGQIGIPIGHKWWEPGAFGLPEQWGGKDGKINRDMQCHLARTNMRAIKESEVVFVLWPDHDARSTCESEMAFALALGKRLAVTGRRASSCTWTALASYRDSSDLCGLTEVARWYVEANEFGLKNKPVKRWTK